MYFLQADIRKKKKSRNKLSKETKKVIAHIWLSRTSFMNCPYWLRSLSGRRNSSAILNKFKSSHGTSLNELRGKIQHVRVKLDIWWYIENNSYNNFSSIMVRYLIENEVFNSFWREKKICLPFKTFTSNVLNVFFTSRY